MAYSQEVIESDYGSSSQRLVLLVNLFRGMRLKLTCEEISPAGDFWMLAEQGSPLAFGHATPHSEFHSVVEGIGSALEDHWAMAADRDCFALCGSSNEKFFRVDIAAVSLRDPFATVVERFSSGDWLGVTRDLAALSGSIWCAGSHSLGRTGRRASSGVVIGDGPEGSGHVCKSIHTVLEVSNGSQLEDLWDRSPIHCYLHHTLTVMGAIHCPLSANLPGGEFTKLQVNT